MTHVRWRQVGLFYALAFGGMSAVAVLHLQLRPQGLAGTALTALSMFSPLLAAVVVDRLGGRRPLEGLVRPSFDRWLLAAMALPVAAVLLTIAVSALMPGATVESSPDHFLDRFAGMISEEDMASAKQQISSVPGGTIGLVLISLPQALILGATVNALFAFGEEVGWRGWLHRELEPLGFWRQSLVTGLLWGAWHAPIIVATGHNFPEHRWSGVLVFTGVCTAMSPLLAHLRDRGSVWTAAVFHGVFNATATLPMLLVSGHELLIGAQGVAGGLAFVALTAILALRRRRPVET